jgi:hypothetical protein
VRFRNGWLLVSILCAAVFGQAAATSTATPPTGKASATTSPEHARERHRHRARHATHQEFNPFATLENETPLSRGRVLRGPSRSASGEAIPTQTAFAVRPAQKH